MIPLTKEVQSLIRQPKLNLDNFYPSPETETLIAEIIQEQKYAAIIKRHNLLVRNKILLYGPTGNGKTTLAKYMAYRLNLTFLEVNTNAVVSSYLGSSSKNIEKIFAEIDDKCVLFWDEIDSIGRSRNSSSNANSIEIENERMVNSFLVNFNDMAQNVVFVGATNRREVMDKALLRRFNIQFELTNPSDPEKIRFVTELVDFYDVPDLDYIEFLEDCKSYNEIKNKVIDQARNLIIKNAIDKEKNKTPNYANLN